MDSQTISDKIQTQLATQLASKAGQPFPARSVVGSKKSEVLDSIANKLWQGTATLNDLGRGYKHAPHAVGGYVFKYIAHRVNNLDSYDNATNHSNLDRQFIDQNGKGSAFEQNQLITPHHLHFWLQKNPNLVKEAVDNKESLKNLIQKGVGLNVRDIAGQPHVAMTRGLNTSYLGDEMSLSSHADLPDSGFGEHQHNMWVPLDDLWYAYPASHSEARGNEGHENEYLFTPKGVRYGAQPEDVTPSWLGDVSASSFNSGLQNIWAEKSDDDEISRAVMEGRANPQQLAVLGQRGLIGASTFRAMKANPNFDMMNFLDSPHLGGPEALQLINGGMQSGDSRYANGFANPNLTTSDLKGLINSPAFDPIGKMGDLTPMMQNPNFNDEVVQSVIAKTPKSNWHNLLPFLAKGIKEPSISLHRAMLSMLDDSSELGGYGPQIIADSFSTNNPDKIPTAFNNSSTTDKYFRALMNHFATTKAHGFGTATRMLSRARLSDALVGHLVEGNQKGILLPGMEDMSEYDILFHGLSMNQHLTPRQMLMVAKTPTGRDGLLYKKSLPFEVWKVCADEAFTNGNVLQINALFGNLDGKKADHILSHVKKLGDNALAGRIVQLAENRSIPEEILFKHMSSDAKAFVDKFRSETMSKMPGLSTPGNTFTGLDRALVDGILERNVVSHNVKPL